MCKIQADNIVRVLRKVRADPKYRKRKYRNPVTGVETNIVDEIRHLGIVMEVTSKRTVDNFHQILRSRLKTKKDWAEHVSARFGKSRAMREKALQFELKHANIGPPLIGEGALEDEDVYIVANSGTSSTNGVNNSTSPQSSINVEGTHNAEVPENTDSAANPVTEAPKLPDTSTSGENNEKSEQWGKIANVINPDTNSTTNVDANVVDNDVNSKFNNALFLDYTDDLYQAAGAISIPGLITMFIEPRFWHMMFCYQWKMMAETKHLPESNMEGDGNSFGAMFVIQSAINGPASEEGNDSEEDPKSQKKSDPKIVLRHIEYRFGDVVETSLVEEAIRKILDACPYS